MDRFALADPIQDLFALHTPPIPQDLRQTWWARAGALYREFMGRLQGFDMGNCRLCDEYLELPPELRALRDVDPPTPSTAGAETDVPMQH